MCVATSVDVERVFSCGRVLLSHVRNRFTTQSTQAILCLGAWSLGGLAKDCDIMNVARLPDVNGDEEVVFEDGWDAVDNYMDDLLVVE